jgi:hypothetical protein
MSTQLILYPQNYSGYTSSSVALNEYFVDGQNFSQVNASATSVVTQPNAVQNAIDAIAPTVVTNTWYRYYAGSGGGVLETSSKLQFTVTTIGDYGIMQKLSNLTVGAVYVVSIDYSLQTGTNLKAYMYSGTVLQSTHSLAPPILGVLTSFNFTAVTTSQFIVFNQHYFSTASVNELSSISITKQSQQSIQISGDGQVICDLYEEEDIPLTLSIDDFKNVAEKVQSYSKDFNLPATKRNNQIFNNMFEVTRSDDGLIFNPYVKTKCVLKQDGFILFEGYLRLIDVKDKEGEISYNVNLYSEVIALADILKDRTFGQLNLEELAHTYNRTVIQGSWEDGTNEGLPLITPLPTTSFAYDATSGVNHTQVLKYPFIDWTHEILVGGSGGAASAASNEPELPSLETAFRPCIQLKYLINKIFAASGFNWTSDFFDSADFGKLFMDFNWGANNAPNIYDYEGVALQGSATVGLLPATFSDAAPVSQLTNGTNLGQTSGKVKFTAPFDNTTYTIDISYNFVNVTAVSGGTEYYYVRWLHTEAATGNTTQYSLTAFSFYSGGTQTFSAPITILMQLSDTIELQAKNPNTTVIGYTFVVGTVSASSPQITSASLLFPLRGELGQWDFLKGIMTMFNLVSMVDESNPDNILIEPYADIFINNTNGGAGNLTLKDRGIQHDWTDKVDVSEMELKPLTDLNLETIFKFVEDDDDYCFNVFKRAQSGHLYGSKVLSASGFTILQGTKEIIAEPFAATVSKPLMDVYPDFIVPMLFTLNSEGKPEGFDNSPRILYNNDVKGIPHTYYIPNQNGVGGENADEFLQFSHLSAIPTVVTIPPAVTDTRDFVFESSQLAMPIGSPPVDNLFNTYWFPYFSELYNANTRTMILKVNLSPSDVAAFKFYDTVFIKNRSFRVNKIEYKPNSLATVEFILIA